MVDTPENINSEAQQQETGNREIDALNTMLRSGESAENINNSLNANFLENLKNGLHPDTAKQLRDAIKWINWYDAPNSNLKQLYDYVVSICDAFDTTGKENDEHEDITDSLTMNDVLDQRFKQLYLDRINFVECISAVAQDGSVSDNFLSAIKGVLNWEKISWGFLVKIAEFLGIDTKRDNRYGSRRIKNLWEKVFSMTDEKWLFAKLWKMYEHMDTNTNVVNFRNNSFEGRSLNDICNLLKINWNWDDINKTDPKVTLFCRSLKLNSETFAQQFSAKNLERKNTNTEALNNLSILSLLDQNKAITKTETEWTYKYGDVEFTQANFLTQLGITPDTIKTNLEGAWAVFAWSELENAISSKQNERFNKIKAEANDITPKFEITSLKEDQINIHPFNDIEKKDIVDMISNATSKVDTYGDPNQQQEYAGRINKVVSAMKDGWNNPINWSQSIKTLQNEINGMKDELWLKKSLDPDWKLWRNTFFAIKEYLWVASRWDKLRYETNRGRLWNTLNGALQWFDDLNTLQTILWDDNGNLWALQDKAEDYIRNPLKFVVDKLSEDNCQIAWKKRILDTISKWNWDNMRVLQLSLLPNYKWTIDGKMWPLTTRALQDYIEKNISGNENDITPLMNGSNDKMRLKWDSNQYTSYVVDRVDWDDNKGTYYGFDWTVIKDWEKNTSGENIYVEGTVNGKSYRYSRNEWPSLKVKNADSGYDNIALTNSVDENWINYSNMLDWFALIYDDSYAA